MLFGSLMVKESRSLRFEGMGRSATWSFNNLSHPSFAFTLRFSLSDISDWPVSKGSWAGFDFRVLLLGEAMALALALPLALATGFSATGFSAFAFAPPFGGPLGSTSLTFFDAGRLATVAGSWSSFFCFFCVIFSAFLSSSAWQGWSWLVIRTHELPGQVKHRPQVVLVWWIGMHTSRFFLRCRACCSARSGGGSCNCHGVYLIHFLAEKMSTCKENLQCHLDTIQKS